MTVEVTSQEGAACLLASQPEELGLGVDLSAGPCNASQPFRVMAPGSLVHVFSPSSADNKILGWEIQDNGNSSGRKHNTALHLYKALEL